MASSTVVVKLKVDTSELEAAVEKAEKLAKLLDRLAARGRGGSVATTRETR